MIKMPRRGSRPYECVRRAWHCERHHPIRGSLIQDIFRIANEIHCPATKKKKEWQEKLPIVVLKAEEIMYSKANSEAEYMNVITLWDRTNDAINTIIRREEGSEDTGEFLQPCIEAALQLGCFPRRGSRSQRNNNPVCYLTRNSESIDACGGNPKPTSSLAPHYSNFLGKKPKNLGLTIKSCLNNEPHSRNGLPCQGSFPSQSYVAYTLYYGAYSKHMEPELVLGDHSTIKYTGNSYSEMGVSQRISLFNEENIRCRGDQPKKECDLSLRLGLSSIQEDEDAISVVGQARPDQTGPCASLLVVGRKQSKETFSMYHESNSGSRDESLDVNLMARKRKAID
ncbi:uncharacterized protein LOC130804674 isoform X2 [Amaranthus tricolor]|uniref:uncharacterized protein LOC130804674 isoform X2 n=1 Tax=Amaranthus tricolor TaxID=29722 RepID=UPI002582D14E|nr:uncharacterized protein LOC130804674 isoform X2 [Amaranthus tricolor]